MTNTCQNLVERRSGYSMTTGHGDRAGSYTTICGKPTSDDSRYCNRCTGTRNRQHEAAHAKHHNNIIALANKNGETVTDRDAYLAANCNVCKRNA